MQIKPTYVHLIDLDALLDTRLGAVSHFSNDHALKLLKEGWQGREMDSIIWKDASFTEQEYKAYLGQGHVETLMRSGPTMLSEYIKELIHELLKEPQIGVSDQTHQFIINTYPYRLERDVLREIEEVIWEQFPFAVSVKTVRFGLNALEPLFLKEQGINFYYTYNLNAWIKKHVDLLNNCPIPQISIVGPAIREHDYADLEGGDELKALAEKMSPFEAMTMSLCIYVNVDYVEPQWFSLIGKPSTQHKEEG